MSQTSQEESKILNVVSKSLCELSSPSPWAPLSSFYSSDLLFCYIKTPTMSLSLDFTCVPRLGSARMVALPYVQGCFFRSILFSQISLIGFENRYSLCGPFPCCAFIGSISHHQSYFAFYLHNFLSPTGC